MPHTYQAFQHCIVLSHHGKVFRSTTDIHMWLQFQQLKISASVEALHYLSFVNDSPLKGSSYLSQGQK